MSYAASSGTKTIHGIDFSGDVRQWRSGCGDSNVWIATAEIHGDAMELVSLRPVQDLSGNSHPFERLIRFLDDDEYLAAGIDAPFALPARYMPAGGFPQLLRDVAEFPRENRPFPRGEELYAYAEANFPLETAKPLRRTERVWKARGATVRSSLWNGGEQARKARPGTPFTVACIFLLAQVERDVWPWSCADRGLLVESFPAGQLLHWGLPHQKYSGDGDRGIRDQILEGISTRIKIPDCERRRCQDSADALDSVLCLFSAKAVVEGLEPDDREAATQEGWIAVHP